MNLPTKVVTDDEKREANRHVFMRKHLKHRMQMAVEAGDFEAYLECMDAMQAHEKEHTDFWNAITLKYDLLPDAKYSIDGFTGEIEEESRSPFAGLFSR